MRVLITGVTGFVGGHLARHVASFGGVEISGIRRGAKPAPQGVKAYDADLLDAKATASAVAAARPDAVFHLAAQSSVSGSWSAPGETIENNVAAERNLFDAIVAAGLRPAVLIASSSEAYGKVPQDELPVSEGRVLRPVTPYGMSKVAQEALAERYRRAHGLHVVVTRGFNQTGPGQDERLVASDFARQAALIEAGRQEPVIRTGNVAARRDFTDVRDVVKAYWLAAEKGASGDAYNVCSGEAHAIAEILETYRRLSRKPFEVRTDPARLRPVDVPVMVGDPRKLRERTGWRAEIPFERMLGDVFEYWRKKVAEGI